MEQEIKKAVKHLKKDRIMAQIVSEFDVPVINTHKKYFQSLVRSIIYQQLSGKSAESIQKKFTSTLKNKVTPENILSLSDIQFKNSGISPQKMGYLRDLSLRFTDGTVNPKNFHKMSDSEIIEHLVKVKGVGVWTTQMFLMFTLGRMDVLPVGDLGIQKGFKYAFRLKKLPDTKKMEKISKNWSPYRTIACMYLWKVADKEK